MTTNDLPSPAHAGAVWIARRRDTAMRQLWRTRLLLLGIMTLCSLLLLAHAETAEAATFTVEDGAAVGDNNPGDGECKSKFRPGTLLRNCTLMAAVEESNALPGLHTILVPAGTFRFDSLQVGDGGLNVSGRMVIVGAGASQTEIKSFGLLDRHLAVLPGGRLDLRNVTYRDSTSLINGGGQLLIENSVIRDNVGIGGGVFHNPIAPFNTALSSGSNVSTTTIRNSRITNNKTVLTTFGLGGGTAAGGVLQNGGELLIESSTIDGNIGRSNPSIGGVVIESRILGSKTTLRNVTISGNIASDVLAEGGGGLQLACTACDALFENLTVANNTRGGLISANDRIPQSFQMHNTLVANNGGLNCSPGFNALLFRGFGSANNLDDGNTCQNTNSSPTSLFNATALLGPLQNNGGPTLTHAILPGSQAVDSGSCRLLVDQRGHARPLDGDGNGVDQCDIGAFEKARARPFGGGVGVPSLNPAVSSVQVNETLTETFAWDIPAPRNWGTLGTMDFRLRGSNGAIVFWVHWDQVLDTYQVFDANGQPTGFALPPGLAVLLSANGVTLDVGGVRTQGSGITGQRATLTLPLRFDASNVGKTFAIEVSASDDDGRQDAFKQLGTIAVLAAAGIGPKPNDDDDVRRLTETQRHQRSRTNQSGLDDERVEGNVVAVRADLPTPEVDIANRDGVVTLRLVKDAAKLAREIRPGDYVSGDGQKEHEQLYWVEDLDIER